MTKIDDPKIKTKDRALQEHISNIVTLWNRGKFSFSISASSSPTDTPSDVEFRVWDSGAGAVKFLIFVPGSESAGVGWWSVSATELTN